jgi:hypothetical protein
MRRGRTTRHLRYIVFKHKLYCLETRMVDRFPESAIDFGEVRRLTCG